jgi:hypothetical protein
MSRNSPLYTHTCWYQDKDVASLLSHIDTDQTIVNPFQYKVLLEVGQCVALDVHKLLAGP